MIDWIALLISVAKTLGIIFLVVMPMVAYTVYAERRVCAFIQDRVGPNRVGLPLTLFGFKKDVGLLGLGQPVADAVKLFLKEDFTPAHVNKFYYWLAPALAVMPSLIIMGVIPFGSTLFGSPMVVADLNVGVLFVFAIASMSVYGITLAGWSSNSKYPFLGGIRSSSQMISYELAMGLSVIPVFLLVGKLNLSEIVRWQVENGWLLLPFSFKGFSLEKLLLWIPMVISFVVFTISMFAETNRTPFDLPESEQELVGGYHTEYSSMKFALFFLGEYAAMIAGSSVIVTLFLGGWHFPGIPDGSVTSFLGLPGWVWGLVNIGTFFAKVACLLFLYIWVRWTLPRFRYDQLMRLGWIWLFEIALANIFLAAGILAFVTRA